MATLTPLEAIHPEQLRLDLAGELPRGQRRVYDTLFPWLMRVTMGTLTASPSRRLAACTVPICAGVAHSGPRSTRRDSVALLRARRGPSVLRSRPRLARLASSFLPGARLSLLAGYGPALPFPGARLTLCALSDVAGRTVSDRFRKIRDLQGEAGPVRLNKSRVKRPAGRRLFSSGSRGGSHPALLAPRYLY